MSSASANVPFPLTRAPSRTKFLSLILATLHKTMVRCVACFGSLLFVGSICAQSLNIAASSAQYTTYVWARDDSGPPISRTTISSSPISDAIVIPIRGGIIINHAIANAGLFDVSDETGVGFANASATSQLWFSPLVDQTQTVGIQISVQNWPFNGGSVSLLDLTSNYELWNYSWLGDPGNVPWEPGTYHGAANFTLDTDFLASHEYELTMATSSNAGMDHERVQIQLTGLQVVPEPSTALLLAVGGAALAISRRRR